MSGILKNLKHGKVSIRSKAGSKIRNQQLASCSAQLSEYAVLPACANLKAELEAQLEGLDRGIYGVKAMKMEQIHHLIERIESLNQIPEPTSCLEWVDGEWRLLYSTIYILGTKRSKLGLRQFVRVGEMFQDIDVANKRAINRVQFQVSGLITVRGALTIHAKFAIVDSKRVQVTFEHALLEPEQLQKLFEANYDLLLSIFNPEGWLDMTYVDSTWRIGRDDKGNVFVLERVRKSA